MSKDNKFILLLLAILFPFVIALAWPSKMFIEDCQSKGGVAVKSSEGYTCIDRKTIKQKTRRSGLTVIV